MWHIPIEDVALTKKGKKMLIMDIETIPANITDVVKAEVYLSGVKDIRTAWKNIMEFDKKCLEVQEEPAKEEEQPIEEKPKKTRTTKKAKPATESQEDKKRKTMLSLWTDLAEANDTVVKQASIDPMFCRIVSIAIIVPTADGISEKVFFSEKSERDLLESFWEYVSEERVGCQTITYNGIGFDIPVLYIRSMVNGVKIAWKDKKLRRYSDYPHFDVMQMLSYWGISKYKSLDWWAKILGYECEPGIGPDGSWVSKWFSFGEYDKIKEYNMEDCRKLLFVYRKMRDFFPPLPADNPKTRRNPTVGSSYE